MVRVQIGASRSTTLRIGCSDYLGAVQAGIFSMLIRRPGRLGEEERKEGIEDLTGIHVVNSFDEVVNWIRRANQQEGQSSSVP